MNRGPLGNRHFEDFRKPKKIEEGGVLNVSGAFLLDHEEEIINLIKHEGRLAEEKNPLHKVSKIEKVNGGIVVEITDHNLTLHIGKRLSHAYKGKHSYKFLKGEKFVEVDWSRDE
jgi:hypothetical protein